VPGRHTNSPEPRNPAAAITPGSRPHALRIAEAAEDHREAHNVHSGTGGAATRTARFPCISAGRSRDGRDQRQSPYVAAPPEASDLIPAEYERQRAVPSSRGCCVHIVRFGLLAGRWFAANGVACPAVMLASASGAFLRGRVRGGMVACASERRGPGRPRDPVTSCCGWLSEPAGGRAPARRGFPGRSPGPIRDRPGNRPCRLDTPRSECCYRS
jgi:hypothetical protein